MSATGTFKRNDRNIPLNEKQSVKISLRNLGLNPITSFEFSYQFGSGEVKSIAHNLTTALAPGKTEEYTFEIPAEVEGMGALHNSSPQPTLSYRRDSCYWQRDGPHRAIHGRGVSLLSSSRRSH